MTTAKLSIVVQTDEFSPLLREAAQLIAQAPEWLSSLAAEAFQRLDEVVELLPIDLDSDAAAATGELRIVAKPTDKFLLLVSALRAGDRQLRGLVDGDFEHGVPHD